MKRRLPKVGSPAADEVEVAAIRAVRLEIAVAAHLGAELGVRPEAREGGRGGEELGVRGQDPRHRVAPAEDRRPRCRRSSRRRWRIGRPRASGRRAWRRGPFPRSAQLVPGRRRRVRPPAQPERQTAAQSASAIVDESPARHIQVKHRSGAGGSLLAANLVRRKARRWPIMDDGWATSSSSRSRPRASERPSESQSADRARRSRTALVLGGGGFTGGVYEIGALRALDLLAVNRTVNQFDVYVGTSAGAFVGSLAANGVTPEEMMRVVNQQVPTAFRDLGRASLMRPNYLEFAQSAAFLPLRMLGLARSRGEPARPVLDDRPGRAPRPGSPLRHVRRHRHPGVPRGGPGRRSRPHERLPPAGQRAVPRGHGSRHLRADRARRRGVGRRADLEGRGRLDGAPHALQADRDPGSAARGRRASGPRPTWTSRWSAARSS